MSRSGSSREIEPERLGRIGEDHFRLLYNMADLVPEKSDIDVTGWDFVVEKLPEADTVEPLDQRRVQAAHVQLKTTRGRSNNRVRLSLQGIGEDQPDNFEGLYFDSALLGDAGVSYAVQGSFERTRDPVWVYRTTGFQALDVSPITVELDEYGAEQMRLHDLNVALDPASFTRTHPSAITELKPIAEE